MNENIVTNPIRLISNNPLDIKNASVETIEDLYAIPMNERYIGMTKLVRNEKSEYWLVDNLSNSAWKPKTSIANVIISGDDVETLEEETE